MWIVRADTSRCQHLLLIFVCKGVRSGAGVGISVGGWFLVGDACTGLWQALGAGLLVCIGSVSRQPLRPA